VGVSLVRLVYIPPTFSAIGHGETEFNTRKGFSPDGAFHAVLAFDGCALVGAFRASLENGLLWAGGTWVDKAYRRAGVALCMWKLMLRELEPEAVQVVTITRGGKRLVAALKKKYPRLLWGHENEAT